MIRKRFSGALLAAILLIGCSAACAEWLVTPKEAADSAAQFKKFPGMSAKAMPVLGAPEISLIKPSIFNPLCMSLTFTRIKPQNGGVKL